MVYRQFNCQRLNFLLRLTFGTLINSLLLLLLLFCACKNMNTTLHIKCTVKSRESHSASLSEFLSLQCSFDDLTITFICHLCSYTTATPVTMPTTTPPTPAPMDQYIALQSLASKTVAAAQTGRMASLVNLDILSVEVTDPEPPRELPKGWKRAIPADGNYSV